MFDVTAITVVGGNGGNGRISFVTEPLNPHGGPDGGDGGDGGSVDIVTSSHRNTLGHLENIRMVEGHDGVAGGIRDRKGRRGKDVRIEVPVGTVVWEEDREGNRERFADLVTAGARVRVARGGRYGRGNHRFATATNQAPLLAEVGEEGESRSVVLEVRLVADVALVGAPNAGKSTLLASVTKAKPKIAAYPFTTMEPVLGVVERKRRRIVLVDVPGLIEGAHEGRGLGLEFMRHATRVQMLVHLIDGTTEDLVGEYQKIDTELEAYGDELSNKPRLLVINKLDVEGVEERVNSVREELALLAGSRPMAISAAAGVNVGELLDKLLEMVPEEFEPPLDEDEGEEKVETLVAGPNRRETPPSVTVKDGVYIVSSRPIERLMPMVRFNNWRARLQFHNELERRGVIAALEEAGAVSGDTVVIAGEELEWD